MEETLPPASLQEYIHRLQKAREIRVIHAEVDPYLEIAEITRRVVTDAGPALLFTHVKGSRFSVATNLYGSKTRLEIAFGKDLQDRIQTGVSLLTSHFPPSCKTLWEKKSDLITALRSLRISKRKRWWLRAPKSLACEEYDLNQLPLTTSWKEDGGPFITLPLVYTESPGKPHSKNLGMYRIQRFDHNTTALHWQIGKGGGFHFCESEARQQNLPVSIFIGGPPALTLAAIAPLPENVPELLFASFVLKRPLKMARLQGYPHAIPCEADFTLLGYAEANTRRLEGPFGDHFGYLSLAHEFPLFRCQKIFHRKDAIYPATVVGPPPQEDLYIGEFLQTAFKPFFPIVMPTVRELHTYPESGFHPLCSVAVHERYEKEALSSSLRVLGEGQLSLTKILITIDGDKVDLRDFRSLFTYLLERMRPEEDCIILSQTANDTLDYTGPHLNRGSKAIFIGTGNSPRRLLPRSMPSLPKEVEEGAIYCPGCLVLSIKKGACPKSLLHSPSLSQWPCIIVIDEAPQDVVSSQLRFLWTVFTRFEPGNDLFFSSSEIRRNMTSFSFPMLIDARMKPTYPPPLVVDEQTEELVTRRWAEYFCS